MVAFSSFKGGHVTIFIRLIAVLVYTVVIVHIIRYHDGPYLKESSSMTMVESSQKSIEESSNSESHLSDSHENTTAATESTSSPPGASRKVVRLLCWLMTDPSILDRAKDARDTWMRGCDVALFMSSKENKEFPTVGLNVSEGRNHIAEKSKASWTYIYKNHRNDAEFFMKADPDSYVVVDHLKRYLANRDPDEPAIYGHNLYFAYQFHYVAGEAVVLGRESLTRLVTEALPNYNCFVPGQAEDLKTCYCLSKVGGYAIDTRDENGRETFLPPFRIKDITKQLMPAWYKDEYRKAYGYCQSVDCLSNYPIVFHYVPTHEFYVLDYLLRKRRIPYPPDDDPQFRFNGTRLTSFNYTVYKGNMLWSEE